MPTEEIRAVLSAEDPEIVHRYLELHRERLEERVAEQRRALESVEQILTRAIVEHRSSSDPTSRVLPWASRGSCRSTAVGSTRRSRAPVGRCS
jgi:hypothetical protein